MEALYGGHQVAQKSIITALPRNCERAISSPLRSFNKKSAAGVPILPDTLSVVQPQREKEIKVKTRKIIPHWPSFPNLDLSLDHIVGHFEKGLPLRRRRQGP